MIGKIFCAVQNIHSADPYGIHLIGRIRGGEPIPMRLELREGLIVVHTL